jgi:hypothetical protein
MLILSLSIKLLRCPSLVALCIIPHLILPVDDSQNYSADLMGGYHCNEVIERERMFHLGSLTIVLKYCMLSAWHTFATSRVENSAQVLSCWIKFVQPYCQWVTKMHGCKLRLYHNKLGCPLHACYHAKVLAYLVAYLATAISYIVPKTQAE